MTVLCCASVAVLSGCQAEVKKPEPDRPAWDQAYREARGMLTGQEDAESSEPTLTVSAESMPLTEFLRYVSNKTGVSVVASAELQSETVTIEVLDQQVSDLLGMVARRLGVQVTRTGDLYYLGSLRPEDRAVMVRKVRRLDAEDLRKAIQTLTSDYGEDVVYGDGLVVVADRVEVLQRVRAMLDEVEAVEHECWVVQLHILDFSRRDAVEFGIEAEPALEVASTFAAASAGSVSSETAATLEGGLSAVLRASRSREGVEAVAEPVLIMVDGGEGSIEEGESIPIAQRSVSPEGTVRVTGFETVQTGLDLSVGLREVSREAARLELDVSMSEVTGFVEGEAPIESRAAIKTAAVVRSGGSYLVGSVRRKKRRRARRSITQTVRESEAEAGVVQLWARAYRIGGPVKERRADP